MRRTASVLLLLTFCVMASTGLYMALSHQPPPGATSGNVNSVPVMLESGSHAPLTPRRPSVVKEVHEWGGYVMVGLVAIHFAYGVRAFAAYFGVRKRAGQ